MRIIYYSPHPNNNLEDRTGYGTHMREMIAAFRKGGNEVMPVIMGGVTSGDKQVVVQRKSWVKSLVPSYIKESVKDMRLLKFDKEAQAILGDAVRMFNPELIYERANYMQISGVNVASSKGITHALEVNAPYVEEKNLLEGNSSMQTKALQHEKLQLDKTDLVVSISEVLRADLTNRQDIDPEKVIVVPNSVDPVKFEVVASEADRLRKELGMEHKRAIGFAGSIFDYHRVDTLIKVFSNLAKEQLDLQLLIIGGGMLLDDLRSLATKLKLDNRVIFTGEVNEKDSHNCSIYFFCWIRESRKSSG
ncbi:MAG: glycosyltransferase [Bacteroidetes bacterium]|nr:glycosyltransferase [Bacteroidota bacterium]